MYGNVSHEEATDTDRPGTTLLKVTQDPGRQRMQDIDVRAQPMPEVCNTWHPSFCIGQQRCGFWGSEVMEETVWIRTCTPRVGHEHHELPSMCGVCS